MKGKQKLKEQIKEDSRFVFIDTNIHNDLEYWKKENPIISKINFINKGKSLINKPFKNLKKVLA